MRFKIPDFLGDKYPVTVHVLGGASAITVSLSQYIGSLSFSHHMLPAQARDMAAALLACADDADRRDFDECLADVTGTELADLAADLELAAEVTA